jgi:hypothetical protein
VVGGENCKSPFDFAQGRLSATLGMTKGRGRFHLYLMLDESTAGPDRSVAKWRACP